MQIPPVTQKAFVNNAHIYGHVQIRGNRFFGPEKEQFLFLSIFGHIFDARVFIFEDRVLCALLFSDDVLKMAKIL